MLEISKEYCTGCSACANKCPKKAISMLKDEEGFSYPKIDKQKCVDCDLCKKVCPVLNDLNENHYPKNFYAARILNKKILQKSASGGAFTGIVNAFCDKNYVIFGAKFDDEFRVIHDYVDDREKIDCFRKSKYVQSDLNGSFSLVKKFLNENKKVLFSGTPCQVAGLKSFLNKDYDNLLCVDIICHGVPSYKVWRKYLEFIVKKTCGKKYEISSIADVEFRKKINNNGVFNSKNLMINFKNGKSLIVNSERDLYLKGYSARLFLRPSCSKCKFASKKRYSDITIADCWGIENIYPNIDPHSGESLLIINTKKGRNILNEMKEHFLLISLDEDFVCKYNECYYRPTSFHKKRKSFFDNIDRISFKKNILLCLKTFGLTNKVKVFIPKPIKKIIHMFIKRG